MAKLKTKEATLQEKEKNAPLTDKDLANITKRTKGKGKRKKSEEYISSEDEEEELELEDQFRDEIESNESGSASSYVPKMGVEKAASQMANLHLNNDRRASIWSESGGNLQKQSVSMQARDAPQLLKFDRPEVITFMEEKEKYEHHCITYGAIPEHIDGMMSKKLRSDMCELLLGKSNENVDGIELENYLVDYINETKVEGGDFKEAFADIQMDLKISCPVARVMDYKGKISKLLEEKGWSNTFKGKTAGQVNKKLFIKFLTNGIRPRELKQDVTLKQNAQILQPGEIKNDPIKFWVLLRERTILQDTFAKNRRSNPDKEDNSSKKKRGKRYHEKDSEQQRKRRKTDEAYAAKKDKDDKRGKYEGKRTPRCYNCEGAHRLKDCNKISEAEKNKVMERMKSKWADAKKSKARRQ